MASAVDTVAPADAGPPGPGTLLADEPRSRGAIVRGWLIELWHDKPAAFAVLVLLSFVFVAAFGPLIAPHDPREQVLLDRLLRPALWGGDWSHPLGTDALGRDILSRMMYGCRTTLFIGMAVVLIAGTIGTVAGLVAGYRGGRTDAIIMRIIDTQFAFPGLLLAITIITMAGPGVKSLIVVLSLGAWMIFARIVRAAVLATKAEPYVEAAVIAGCKERRIIFRHLLPNLVAPIMTLSILEFAVVVLAEASLSFLALGVQSPTISWGADIAGGRNYIFDSWWVVSFPGIALAIVVVSSNLVSGWLRVAADPQARDKRFAGMGESSGM